MRQLIEPTITKDHDIYKGKLIQNDGNVKTKDFTCQKKTREFHHLPAPSLILLVRSLLSHRQRAITTEI
jgi:hypothetical protein